MEGGGIYWTRKRQFVWAMVIGLAVIAGAGLNSPFGRQATSWAGNRARNVVGASAGMKPARERMQVLVGEDVESIAAESRIEIVKSERRLDLYRGDELVKSYRIALGGHPEGTKLQLGDGATPEGEYVICTRLPRSRFHRFLGLNYPNAADADAGLKADLIDEEEHRAMLAAAKTGAKPSWETKMGGAIGIHGSGSQRDWTLGCIALDDEDIDEIWLMTKIGTRVSIRPCNNPPS